LWRAAVANPQIGKKAKDDAFYKGQVKSLEYFAKCVLPITLGKMEAILGTSGAPVEIDDASFGG